ncbi:MAG: hypothetical protein R3284_00135 [Rubricoccaceae bacterium]|nr:hypothetical protein [Rubricoccaceae bacterium]
MKRPEREVPAYLDTPRGLVTPEGTKFLTTESLLNEFAGEVLQKVSLSSLVRRTEIWLRSPSTITMWALPLLLAVGPVWLAGLLALLLYFGWSIFAPSFPFSPLIALHRQLERPLLLAVYYIIGLTLLAWSGNTAAAVVGLVVFVAFRLRLAEYLLRPPLSLAQKRMYPLPIPDQILRALILRSALRHGISLPELNRLEESARNAWLTSKD